MRLAEGLPPDTPPGTVWEVAWLRRSRTRESLEALAWSIFASIGTCLAGGDASAVSRPFYSASEWRIMEEEAEKARQMNAQLAQLDKLKRMMKRDA